jgi:hypothetical protein
VFLELEGAAVVDVVTDVFLVGEHLAHSGARPVPPKVRAGTLGIEPLRNIRSRQVVIDEPAVDLIDDRDLSIRSRLQDDAVGLQALVFAARQFALH